MLPLYIYSLQWNRPVAQVETLVSIENINASSFSREQQIIQAEEYLQLGTDSNRRSNYRSALEFYENSLKIYRAIRNRHGEARVLYFIGTVYLRQNNYEQAEDMFQQSLSIAQQISSRDQEWQILTVIGLIYTGQGRYNKALQTHQQALSITQLLGQPLSSRGVLNNIANVYIALGQYSLALETYQEALSIVRREQTISESVLRDSEDEILLRNQEGILLTNIGNTYVNLKKYSEAIQSYELAAAIFYKLNDQLNQAESFDGIGNVYSLTNRMEQALTFLQKALRISRAINDFSGSARTLDGLGNVYTKQERSDLAWETYQQALEITLAINDRAREHLVLSHIGDLLVQQHQSELAIIFYKRSVNVTEEIRRDIQGLPIEQQQSYTNTVADTYRKLADLLLQQDRILEAQQVLDLLKVQEIQDYLRRGVRGTEQTDEGIYLLEAEQRVLARFDELLQQGQRLTELEAISPEDLTPEEQAEFRELAQRRTQIKATFNQFLARPDIQHAVRLLQADTSEALDIRSLDANRQNLASDTVLLYPLVLDDRLELVLLSPNSPPLHKTVEVTRVELNQAINDFLSDLRDPTSNPKPNAVKLYNWLIRPIEPFLTTSSAKVILYAPDYRLRYIPLAALYDGQQWFVEKYQINQITSTSLTNLSTPPRSQPRILAGAYSEGRYLISRRRGEDPFSFNGLPFAKVEVQTI